MVPAVVRVLQSLRHVPDRVLHPMRRRAAERRVRGRLPASVLFVCYGNLCRSPFAAALFERLAARRFSAAIHVTSRGFVSGGRTSPAQAVAAAERHGVDLSAHRSNVLTPASVRAASLVVVMSADQARVVKRLGGGAVEPVVLGDFDTEANMARTIADPWGGTDRDFELSYERIVRCIEEFARVLAGADE